MARLILLGQNIKKYRKAKGLKQVEVALALNCTYEFVSKVENGQRYLSLRRLFNLADILNVEVKDLMNFK
ncbi:helix-turn-helix transcriptional regulator [bacterium]|nr:helix-turn-helix transcriptional regulator [bacterium]MBP3847228.1 helix-turn-helix transcriptional regulator [bacterium]